jgi:hypothetical protein
MARVTGSELVRPKHPLVFLCPANGTGSSLGYPRNSEKSVNNANNTENS